MPDSDIITAWVDSTSGKAYLQDRHATGNMKPDIDSEQNVDLIWGSEIDGTTAIRFKRKIRVCDTLQDRDIVVGTNRVIFVCVDDF